MNLKSLSEKLLKNMVSEYADSGKDMFSFDYFKSLYPDQSDDFISKALYVLESDGFAEVFSADNVAYTTTLLPDGILSVDENTWIRKGYTIIKEIRLLIR